MFTIICVCIFVTNYVNAYHNNNQNNNEVAKTVDPNDDKIIRKMLAYFQESSWEPQQLPPINRIYYGSPVNIIENQMTYQTTITIKQVSQPYLFKIMQMMQIKGQVPFQNVYTRLFKYFIAIKQFNIMSVTSKNIVQILQFVFPELEAKIYEIAKYPIGPPMLRIILELLIPYWPRADLNIIFKNAPTMKHLIINIVLYLCPNIREHFMWNENAPLDIKLQIILKILYPGVPESNFAAIFNAQNDFHRSFYAFLDALFSGKLTSSTNVELKPEGPEWNNFLQVLYQFNINYQTLSNDILWYMYSNFKTPQFKIYVTNLKEKLEEEKKPPRMDDKTLQIWMQFLNDLHSRQKSLSDMPQEIRIFLQQYENPQEFIKILSDTIGFQVDISQLKNKLDPRIMDLWKNFIFDIICHNGDTTHFPKELLDYFYNLSNNSKYLKYLDVIFDSISINPKIVVKWNDFFDQVQKGIVTLDQMPVDLITFLMEQKYPQEFLRMILKLKNSKFDTQFINIDNMSPHILQLWQQYIKDIAGNKGKIGNIPTELLDYFLEISKNPTYIAYLKILFGSDKIKPQTLEIWNQFITGLKDHRVQLKDMPPELINLMLKYNSPDEFFKILLPGRNYEVNKNLHPSKIVQSQWNNWLNSIKNRNASIEDTPDELKNYFYEVSPSKNYKDALNQIYSLNPQLLQMWRSYTNKLKQHISSIFEMPYDLRNYIIKFKSPKEFVNLIFQGLDHPINHPIPEPSDKVREKWELFLGTFTSKANFDGIIIDDMDGIEIFHDVVKYMFDASTNEAYKQTVCDIFQMDQITKKILEDFKTTIQNDYNVTMFSLPERIYYYGLKFENPGDFLRSIMAAYHEGTCKVDFREFQDHADIMTWFAGAIKLKNNHKLIPNSRLSLTSAVKNTSIQNDVEKVMKTHDYNMLINNIESAWLWSKNKFTVHDGLKVFLEFLENLGYIYKRENLELCDDRRKIIESLELLKKSFAKTELCEKIDDILLLN